jgi:hypothetical protein
METVTLTIKLWGREAIMADCWSRDHAYATYADFLSWHNLAPKAVEYAAIGDREIEA